MKNHNNNNKLHKAEELVKNIKGTQNRLIHTHEKIRTKQLESRIIGLYSTLSDIYFNLPKKAQEEINKKLEEV